MIYEDERTVDEIVDEFFTDNADGTGEGVREAETNVSGGGGTEPMKRVYLNRCRDCRQTFETPYVGGKYCPACKRKRISEGQKARQAREHAVSLRDPATRRAGANSQQVKNGDKTEPEGAGAVENSEKTVAEAWAQLAEPTAARSAGPEEPEPESHPREAREVLMDLYGTVRNLARAAGLDPSRTIEALWEVDSILGNVGRA